MSWIVTLVYVYFTQVTMSTQGQNGLKKLDGASQKLLEILEDNSTEAISWKKPVQQNFEVSKRHKH